MANSRLDYKTLSKSTPTSLIRLAKYIGITVKDDCVCDRCNMQLVIAVVKKLDIEDLSWQQRNYDRKW